ncbi:MAG: glycosyltransferase family 9 protein [Elusimicrobia bacterium]|nr:glycosyltransferase family 9 protein [Elusimicrobiota bacterium]
MRMPQASKILVIQLRRIGDALLASPAVKLLRAAYPQAELDFLVEPSAADVLRGNPDISELLVYDKKRPLFWLFEIRRRRYDLVIDYMGNPRSGLLAFASGARIKAGPGNVFCTCVYNSIMPLGVPPVYSSAEKMRMLAHIGIENPGISPLPVIFPGQEHKDWARETLANLGLAPEEKLAIAFAPASRKTARAYPPRHYAALAAMITSQLHRPVLLITGHGEEAVAGQILKDAGSNVFAVPPAQSLRHLAALLARCALLVTNCNGPKHIAIAAGTPTLTIHGSSDPLAWTPSGFPEHQYIVNSAPDCIPCRRNDCPRGDLACLENLDPALVYNRILEMPGIN